MIIFEPKSKIIEVLESGSIPFKKQNIIPVSIGKTSNAISSNLGGRQRKTMKKL